VEGFDRRKFLKGSSVAAGLAGALTVVPGALPAFAKGAQKSSGSTASGHEAPVAAATPAASTDEPIVAHIRDAQNGEIDLFVGTRHLSIRDQNLTHRILNATR
jgi:anaerobic selenocysteine-containing dehydrogenase